MNQHHECDRADADAYDQASQSEPSGGAEQVGKAREGRTRRAYRPVAERRREIVRAAIEVMRRDGAWSLTTRAVAEEAGISLGSVHYAFGSKNDLIVAVFDADNERATRRFRSALDEGGEPADILERALIGHTRDVIDDASAEAVVQELYLLGLRDPGLAPHVQAGTEHYRREAVKMLHAIADRSGGLWDVPIDVLAEQILALLFGTAAIWLTVRNDELFLASVRDGARTYATRLKKM
ncbi:TetR/AcrR family transcriptional regulator [Devriesea agamarum]|uniref:TetR/AcrR family transcriptional regulator n=1 Tax=Devriesea agamarum TaxID=472569 RepID=UPI00071CDB7E|nr:TetR/AcrR family transcriptional regulator [Devriesea agamarum]